MDISRIKQTPIAEYLASLGYHPSINRGNGKLRYEAKWHGGENPQTVCVDTNKNEWYDFSWQCGGSVIELCMAVHSCDKGKALQILTEYNGKDVPKVKPIIPEESHLSKASVIGVRDINNIRLIDYFHKRGINVEWLKAYCKQIYYKIEGKETLFYAIGMENKSGGWIYRTAAPTGKGCIGVQDITVIPFNNSHSYMVFEGFTNFLSYLVLYGKPTVNVIILNSVTNTNKAVTYLRSKRPSAIYLLLDNDNAGNIATQNFLGQFPDITKDKRGYYSKYNDLNDFLIGEYGSR